MESFKKIDLENPRHDQSTYWGRVRHFIDMTDIRNLFCSSQQLTAAVNLISDYEAGKLQAVSENDLWHAKKLRDSSIHPDTKEPILLPFRMASFVPTNMIVTAGLLIPNPSLFQTVFWQWANQSINVAFNWANANKTTEMSWKETTLAYVGAVGTSCTIAAGLNSLVLKAKAPLHPLLKSSTKFIPFAAVATAGVVNVFLMRSKELVDGIVVKDLQGNQVGKSQKAGFYAVGQVSISRVLTAIPALTFPPIILGFLQNRYRIHKFAFVPLNITLVSFMLMAALPFAIAVFPQQAVIDVKELEPRFHNLKSADGSFITHLSFNKGL